MIGWPPQNEHTGDGRYPELLVVGCGNMGLSVLVGALTSIPGLRATGIDPAPDTARTRLGGAAGVQFVSSIDQVAADAFDIVLLAVKPQMMSQVLDEARSVIGSSLVVSIAAGIALATLSQALPAARLVRVMPNLPTSVGAGMSGAYAGPSVGAADRALAARLFEGAGAFVWLDREAEIDAVTAVSGSGPGYVFALVEQLEAAACALGLPEGTATILARQTIIGAAAMLSRDARSASTLKAAITSPGGTTQAGLAVLEAPFGLPACVGGAVQAAYARALELASPPTPTGART